MESFIIAAVGDLLINRSEPRSALGDLGVIFGAADLVFGNLEGVLTDSHEPLPGRDRATIAGTSNAAGLQGFDVLSLANNHSLDAGYGGLRDTLFAVRNAGIQPIGAGQTPEEAWQPVVFTAEGRTVAFIAVAGVCRVGYEAKGNRGGVAALTAVDYYAPRYPGAYLPGVPPQIVSIANKRDWKQVEAVVSSARKQAEIVVVSIHWGDHTRPFVITDFERETARRLSELGVDLILGHHHHRLRGADFVGSTGVFYGLGHVVFDQAAHIEELKASYPEAAQLTEAQLERRLGRFGIFPRASGFFYDDSARWSAIAIAEFPPSRRPVLGLVPLYIELDNTPRLVAHGSDRWRAFVSFMDDCAREGGLDFMVVDEGREIGGAPILSIQQAASAPG